MLQRTELRRGTKPLKATKPLERHTELAQVGRRRREEAEAAGKPVKPALSTRVQPAVPADERAALAERSGGWCEIALPGCLGQATDPAHRISRKAGGRKGAGKAKLDRLSAVLHSCRQCHMWSTARPAESYDLGLMLREYQNPLQEPVVRRGELVFLDDLGGIHEYEAVGC